MKTIVRKIKGRLEKNEIKGKDGQKRVANKLLKELHKFRMRKIKYGNCSKSWTVTPPPPPATWHGNTPPPLQQPGTETTFPLQIINDRKLNIFSENYKNTKMERRDKNCQNLRS